MDEIKNYSSTRNIQTKCVNHKLPPHHAQKYIESIRNAYAVVNFTWITKFVK